MQNNSSTIKFWRAVELFEPKDISRSKSGSDDEKLFEASCNEDLPWLNQPNAKNSYQVFCGAMEITEITGILEDIFGKDDYENFGTANKGKCAVFTFKINGFGEPIPQSFVLSSSAWLLGKTLTSSQNSNDWLNGFDKDFSEYTVFFEQRIALLKDQKSNLSEDRESINENENQLKAAPVTFEDLENEAKIICHKLGLQKVIISPAIAYKEAFSRQLVNGTTNNESEILNSFIQKDLGFVADKVDAGKYGEGLKDYLLSDEKLDAKSRTDIANSKAILFKNLSPALFPAGRWADDKLYPLAFSQQFSVNSILEKLTNKSGLFSVNGPPGTGKTTMLKDVIAAVIVDRAKRLADYADPIQAFKGKTIRCEKKDYTYWVAPIDEKLKRSGIVIASSNNGAVENVTKEFPVKKKLDSNWQTQCEYFSETATNLIDKPAWGLIAAILGNSSNRYDFVKKFWFAEDGFLSILKQAEAQDDSTEFSWNLAVESFKKSIEQEKNIREKKVKIWQLIVERISLKNELEKLKARKIQNQEESFKVQNNLQTVKSKREQIDTELKSLISQKKINDSNRPSLFSIITSFGKTLTSWKKEDSKLSLAIGDCRDKISQVDQNIWKVNASVQENIAANNRLDMEIAENSRKLERIENDLKKEHNQKFRKDSIPKMEDWNSPDEREMSSPWFDEEWNLARTNVFAKALQLQKAFILANAKAIKTNLSAMMDVLSGKINIDGATKWGSEVWATLFLVIPVISTTFASFDKLFKNLGQEEIGWLLIDEAGQAVPQAAVGAIWRSQRTIAVGDPLQLEPVSTIPEKMQKQLAQYFKISDTWLPTRTSVQELTDRTNKIGTYIKNSDNQVWVGSPLRVHRRCQKPMFDISNKVAYGNMMVYGTKESSKYKNLPASHWINVASDDSSGNWIPAEGIEAEKLIDLLIQNGCSPEQIYLISPFAQVAANLRQIQYRKRIKAAGTVHIMQGKESDVVILVLGGNPHKPGAKNWASSKPNLLNVAVSRAKERLYVIGNKKSWGNLPYFNILDKYLAD